MTVNIWSVEVEPYYFVAVACDPLDFINDKNNNKFIQLGPTLKFCVGAMHDTINRVVSITYVYINILSCDFI